MYGYVVPDKPNLLMKEFSLYRAHYCGICRAIRKLYGQLPRITINYDITFFSVFAHDIAKEEAGFEHKRCCLRAFQKAANITLNPLLEKIAAVNILTAYYKALDNIADEGFKKAVPELFLRRAYKKAKDIMPGADKAFSEQYKRLSALEKAGCESVDMVADCFAEMMRAAGKETLGDKYSAEAGEFLYNLGRWVYLADALDDLDEDFRKKRYNPFLCAYKDYEGREHFIEANRREICGAFYGTMNRMAELLADFNLTQSQNLLRNIAVYGIRNKTAELLSAKAKLKRERV